MIAKINPELQAQLLVGVVGVERIDMDKCLVHYDSINIRLEKSKAVAEFFMNGSLMFSIESLTSLAVGDQLRITGLRGATEFRVF